MKLGLIARASMIAIAAGIAAPAAAYAQSGTDALKDTILVTGTKKADAEDVQDVPLAITAYGADQLDALKVRDLGNLSYAMPNVGLEDIGTSRGVANFSIRGLGVNSSIPSIDPAVGTFVDGIYLGQNAGVVLDVFDLESIEVLRGPQGILFGRNVTGGAVLLNTKRPNLQEAEFAFKGAAESGFRGTGNNYYAMASASAPLVKDVFAFKVSAYYNNDRGYFKNYLGGPNLPAVAMAGPLAALTGLIAQARPDAYENHGKAETWVVRPQIEWHPTDSISINVKYEHFESDGDGPASQNHPGFLPGFVTLGGTRVDPIPFSNFLASFPKDSFTFSIDNPGSYISEADSITARIDIDVPFGDGVITNIFGWRDTYGFSDGDIDGTPFWGFHSTADNQFEQISNEIRYAGRFADRVDVTLGFYYYEADHTYQENRYILGNFRTFFGGGVQDSRNYGIFGQFDYDLTETLTFIAGGRWTNERKMARLHNLTFNSTECSVAIENDCLTVPEGNILYGLAYLNDENTWKNFTPKVGLRWAPRDDLNVYAHWTEGVRSGGYNFRNTSTAYPLAGFNEEKVDAFEFGFKAQPADGKATINAAIFVNKIDDMQREINLADPLAGVVQLIQNTADATIFGFEIETQYFVTDNFVIRANLGHLDGEYETVAFNLNSDFIDANGNFMNDPGETQIIDEYDLALQIPRLAEWTYGAGFIHSMQVMGGRDLTTRFQYSHRDDNPYTDNNLGILLGADILDASIALSVSDRATVSLYGQNLLNEVTHGGETQLPATIGGGTFAPLNKGRILGVEFQIEM